MSTTTEESALPEVITPRQHDHDHLQARLCGENNNHPRQKIVQWLIQFGYGERVGRFNQLYAESLDRSAEKKLIGKENFASYEAFGYLFGEPGHPGLDEQWSAIVA